MWRPSADELEQTFDYYLRRAVFFEDSGYTTCTGLSSEVWHAIARVAEIRSPEAVLAAREQLQREIDRTDSKTSGAVREAFESGLIPEREPDHPEETTLGKRHGYFPEIFSFGYADPEAARMWLETNRENPGEIYLRWFSDRHEPRVAEDAEYRCAVIRLHDNR